VKTHITDYLEGHPRIKRRRELECEARGFHDWGVVSGWYKEEKGRALFAQWCDHCGLKRWVE